MFRRCCEPQPQLPADDTRAFYFPERVGVTRIDAPRLNRCNFPNTNSRRVPLEPVGALKNEAGGLDHAQSHHEMEAKLPYNRSHIKTL